MKKNNLGRPKQKTKEKPLGVQGTRKDLFYSNHLNR